MAGELADRMTAIYPGPIHYAPEGDAARQHVLPSIADDCLAHQISARGWESRVPGKQVRAWAGEKRGKGPHSGRTRR